MGFREPTKRPADRRGHPSARIMYVEQTTRDGRSLNHRGPAVIDWVTFSKTARSVYFDGKTLHRRRGVYGNFECEATGDQYWVSGVKQRYSDRHLHGSGPIVDRTNGAWKTAE